MDPEISRELLDKVTYRTGLNLGRNLRREQITPDLDVLLRGVEDGIAGAEGAYSEEELLEAERTLRRKLRVRQAQRRQALSARNLEEGEAFLEANRQKEGIEVLPSGLQYEVLQEGNGQRPGAEDTITVHFRGMLLDGTEFDSSFKRGQPSTVIVSRMVDGWSEALQLMGVGSRWRLFIPPDLAYGERGSGTEIGPHATLIYEVELLAIEPVG